MNKKPTKQFKIVDCYTNKVYNISANDYDCALRIIANKLGHFSVAFV